MTKKKPGIVIATKEEAFWIDVKKNTENQKNSLEKELKLVNAVLKLANAKIEEEKNK